MKFEMKKFEKMKKKKFVLFYIVLCIVVRRLVLEGATVLK